MGIKIKQIDGLQNALDNAGGGGAPITHSVFNFIAQNGTPTAPGEMEVNAQLLYMWASDSNTKSVEVAVLNRAQFVIVKNITTGVVMRGQLTQWNQTLPLTQYVLYVLDPVEGYLSSPIVDSNFTPGDEIEITFIDGNGIIYHGNTLTDVKIDIGSGIIEKRVYQQMGGGSRPMYCVQGGRNPAVWGAMYGDLKSFTKSGYTSTESGELNTTEIPVTDFGSYDPGSPDNIYYNESDDSGIAVFVNGIKESDHYLDTGGSVFNVILSTAYPIDSTDEITVMVLHENSWPV